MSLDLGQFALVSLIYDDSREHLDRTIRAMRYCRGVANFSGSFLVTACKPDIFVEGLIQIPAMSLAAAQVFIVKTLPRILTDAPFVMFVHDDGFILDTKLWQSEFVNYDYIGAPWGDKVGNEGFSIQSRKMLQAKSRLPWVTSGNSDEIVCREHRTLLVDRGIRFAPVDLASRFSTELTGDDTASFGFHSRTHSPQKYKRGWELIEAWEKEHL